MHRGSDAAERRLARWEVAMRDALRKAVRYTKLEEEIRDAFHNRLRGNSFAAGGGVEELWDELRDASPSGSLVTEGRIVAAGALADQGKVSAAINLLERGWRFPKRAKDYHLRRAYTLADLYERSGTIPKARDLFVWIKNQDKNYGDVVSRIQALQ